MRLALVLDTNTGSEPSTSGSATKNSKSIREEGVKRMLVLSRKTGERIHIGNDVFIEVRRVAGNRVTLAVNAPKSVRILRGELLEAVDSFNVLDDDHALEDATTDTVIMKSDAKSADKTDMPQQDSMVTPTV